MSASSNGDALSSRREWRAWLAAWLGLIILFATFGLAYSFGVFLPALTAEFHIGAGSGSIFFSLTSLLFFGLGIVTGPLSDRFGPKRLVVSGGIFIAAGLWLTASADNLTQAYLCYGGGIGIGVACIFVPVVAAVSQHFAKHRSMALGITVSGIGLGTLVVVPVSEALVAAIGWRETYRIYALASAILLVFSGLIFPTPPRRQAEAPSPASPRAGGLRGRRFPRFYLATILINLGVYVPFAHLPSAAQAGGIPAEQSAQLLGELGVASVVSRVLIGLMGTLFDEWRIYRLCIICLAVGFVCWSKADSFAAYLAYATVGGFGYGGYIALTPAVLGREFAAARPGRVIGITYTAVAVGAAVGPAAVGFLAQALGSYRIPLLILAGLTLAGLLPLTVFPTRPIMPEAIDAQRPKHR